MPRKVAVVCIIMTIIVFNGLRFWKLDSVPCGYHINELGSAVTLQCLSQEGCDAQSRPWPLFGAMTYGQDKPPTYIYPGLVWAKLFGFSVPSLRAFSAFVLLIGMAGLFLLTKRFWGLYPALAVVLAATCSPWSWVVNRQALESFFAPVFAIWALYFFLRSVRWWDWALAGLFFAGAMYAYPPARLQIPLMIGMLGFYDWRRRSGPKSSWFALGLVFVLLLLPMAVMYLHGSLNRRFDEIGIFNQDFLYVSGDSETFAGLLAIFAHNYWLHFNPHFLFLTGDASYLYSTRHLGLLSWLDSGALLIFIVFLMLAFFRRSWNGNPVIKYRRWLLFLGVNYLIGIVPSALTNQELPNALRMCGSWPFMMLFTGLMWLAAAEVFRPCWPAMALLGLLAAAVLAWQYFSIYPQASQDAFGCRAKKIAEEIQAPEDWVRFIAVMHKQQYHCRYFVWQRLGLNCRQAKQVCEGR